MAVSWVQCAGVSDTVATVAAKPGAGLSCRLAVSSTDPTLASGVIYSAAVVSDADGYVILPITGLAVNTAYTYGIEVAGVIDAMRGNFVTDPAAPGVACSFSWGFSSCNLRSTTHKVFAAIAARKLLFFAHIGDMGYSDIATNDKTLFFANFDGCFGSATQGPMFRAQPVPYVWDDHDFCGDNSDNTGVAKAAAQTAFRQCVASSPLVVGDAIYRSFRKGRVKFIMTDLRSFRSVDSATDDASKTMMGATQKAWFKAQLLDSKTNGDQAIFWLSSSVWNVITPFTGIDTDNDHWGAFSTERTEIADFVKANSITGLVVCCGDSHSIGYARAKNCDFATGGGAPIPVLMASALDQAQDARGGNWTCTTTDSNAGQYGVINVNDDGNLLTWDYHAIKTDAASGVDSECLAPFRPSFIPANPPVVASGTLARDWDPAFLIGLKDGDKVPSITDRVAGDALAQATAANQPIFRNTDGGFPAIAFNQTHRISSASYAPSAGTVTFIVSVLKRTGNHLANSGYAYDGIAVGNRRGLLFDNAAGQGQRRRFVNGGSTVSGLASDTELHVVSVTYGATEILRVDGVQQASFAFGSTPALAGFRIGARYDSTQGYIGDVVRLFIYEGIAGADLTLADKQKIENWAIATYMRGAGIFVVDRGMLVSGRLSPVVT